MFPFKLLLGLLFITNKKRAAKLENLFVTISKSNSFAGKLHQIIFFNHAL
jgi:hypothetical protein